MFETVNGFRKSMYWSREKMESHANKYSTAYKNKDKKDSFWHKDFDGMAFKTLIRQLISKWGIMSIEMQNAYSKDMGIIDEKGNVKYVDNDDENLTVVTQDEPNMNEVNVVEPEVEEVTPTKASMNDI